MHLNSEKMHLYRASFRYKAENLGKESTVSYLKPRRKNRLTVPLDVLTLTTICKYFKSFLSKTYVCQYSLTHKCNSLHLNYKASIKKNPKNQPCIFCTNKINFKLHYSSNMVDFCCSEATVVLTFSFPILSSLPLLENMHAVFGKCLSLITVHENKLPVQRQSCRTTT